MFVTLTAVKQDCFPHNESFILKRNLNDELPFSVLGEFYRSVDTKRELSTYAKLCVFIVVFVPIFAYGKESWKTTDLKRMLQRWDFYKEFTA